MIAPRHLERSASLPSLTGSGKPSARNESSLARNLSGISSRNSQPLPVFSRIVFDNDRDIFFSQTSANGKSLSDVNTANHITSFLNDLKNSGANINELTSFEQVAGLSGSCDLKTATLSLGTKSALSLFSLLSADQKDANLMAKAKTFYNAITKKPGSALKEMKAFTSAILEKMELSSKTAEAKDNLKQLCCDYLEKYVYPDILAKLDGKLSLGDMEMLRKNPANVEGHLFMGENEITNNMINELQKEFFEFRGINGKAVVLNSLFKELEHKTQIMAGLIKLDSAAADAPASVSPAAADAPASVAGLTADNDLGQPGPANGNNTANPGPVAPNINNITYNNYYYYNWGTPSSTQNNISTTNTHLPDHADSTKSEEGKSQSAELNQIAMEVKDFSAQTSDEIDSRPVPSPTDNLKHATATNTKADKSLNSAGTLYATTGPAPSSLGQNSTVTLTNDGQVRDLSRKQADGLGGMQHKQSTSLNNFGNQFIGFGKQNPAPAPLGGTGKIQQDAPQVSGMQSSSTVKDIPVSDNALNSGKTPQDADGIYHAVPVNTKADKSLNSAGTLYATTGPAPSWLGQNSTVTLTNDGQVRDLSRKQADGQGGMQQKQ
ncbi:TPA: hypothetical protein PXP51_003067, partial [Yersinia enterocolitica]|nr:hypothetical protein [Yersinia enterocolitica]